MKEKNKFILYFSLFLIALTIFILQIFILESPDGIIGMILCLVCIYMIVGTLIKMCKMNKKFKDIFKKIIDILFWIP